MGFIKGALFGMAVYAAVQHITKKNILTGTSLLDDFLEKAPEVVDNAKTFAKEVGLVSDPQITVVEEYVTFR